MTTILKYKKIQAQYIDRRQDKLPDDVAEWIAEHDIKQPELNYHYGYFVFIFHDDELATAFRMRFGKAVNEKSNN